MNDATIMWEVNRLERYWTDYLSVDWASWQLIWSGINYPKDIKGNIYTEQTPTNMTEIQVTLPRVYAWSQIWGTLRLKLPAMDIPAKPPYLDTPTATWTASESEMTVTAAALPSTGNYKGITLYGTPSIDGNLQAPQHRLRHIISTLAPPPPGTITIRQEFIDTCRPKTGSTIVFRLALITVNNSLDYLSALSSVIIT